MPILPIVADAVAAYLAACPIPPLPDEPLFKGARGGRLQQAVVQKQVRQLRADAGPARDRDAARAAPQLRHPPARRRRRPARDPGAAGPRQPVDHARLHRGRRQAPDGALREGAPARVRQLAEETLAGPAQSPIAPAEPVHEQRKVGARASRPLGHRRRGADCRRPGAAAAGGRARPAAAAHGGSIGRDRPAGRERRRGAARAGTAATPQHRPGATGRARLVSPRGRPDRHRSGVGRARAR